MFHPNLELRKDYIMQTKRLRENPVIKNDLDNLLMETGGYCLVDIEKLLSLANVEGFDTAKKAILFFNNEEEKSASSMYDKNTVHKRLENELKAIKGNTHFHERLLKDVDALFGMRFSGRKTPLLAVYFLVGPSGVGKTEFARRVGKTFAENNVVLIPMSQYAQGSSINTLLGADAGYIGYNDPSPFEAIGTSNDITVVIFDEIEKAAPEVMRALLQILNDGYTFLRNGKKIDFQDTIVFFTSNIGCSRRKTAVNGNYILSESGYEYEPAFGIDDNPETIKEHLVKSVLDFYEEAKTPEFISRVGKPNIIPILPLSDADAVDIVNMMIDDVVSEAREKYGCDIAIEKKAKKALYKIAKKERSSGGRGITKKIDRFLGQELGHFARETDYILIDFSKNDDENDMGHMDYMSENESFSLPYEE